MSDYSRNKSTILVHKLSLLPIVGTFRLEDEDDYEYEFSVLSTRTSILVPRGRVPFGQHQESRPLARSNDIPFLNGFVNTID